MDNLESRLLILSCSQKKIFDPNPLPAIQRYDGPSYRLLRKYLRHEISLEAIPDIQILSAEYGLIPADTPIRFYNRRMTLQRAEELKTQVIPRLIHLVTGNNYSEIFINCGNAYLYALSGFEEVRSCSTKSLYATGSLGGRLAALRKWLYGVESEKDHQSPKSESTKVVFRGQELNLTREQVFQIGRQALAKEPNESKNFQAWYVMIDENPVSPKWLLSQITDIPVSDFHTSDAKRIFQGLGIRLEQL